MQTEEELSRECHDLAARMIWKLLLASCEGNEELAEQRLRVIFAAAVRLQIECEIKLLEDRISELKADRKPLVKYGMALPWEEITSGVTNLAAEVPQLTIALIDCSFPEELSSNSIRRLEETVDSGEIERSVILGWWAELVDKARAEQEQITAEE